MVPGRKPAERAPEMAPGATQGLGVVGSAEKHIPLLCTVCPDTPRFSDVSHLLTHIASKGHLHHETQTKLKAHQDIAASVALRQYEVWYSQNGIETLLVERMKAKQLKEAARTRRNRVLASVPQAKDKRKPNRSLYSGTAVKLEEEDEEEDQAPDLPMYSGLFNIHNDSEAPEEYLESTDMMSLKGQVWPGMGKMDLANEEMKRTRNQRKPKSVIEKMRRTSEGIEPNQVVMTAGFEIERVKGVYDDSSSPIPGQEESTPPRKVPGAKRRKPEPLADISVNIPKQRRPSTRGNKTQAARKTRGKMKKSFQESPSKPLSHSPFWPNHDVFRDDDENSNSLESRRFGNSSQNYQRFDLHDRLGMPPLNPIAQSNLVSPTPSSRDLSSRMFGARDVNRGRTQHQPYLDAGTIMLRTSKGTNINNEKGTFNHIEASYAMKDATIYNASSRLPFNTLSQFSGLNQEPFGLSPSGSLQAKQEDYTYSGAGDSGQRASGSQFLSVSGTNPLLSHDRLLSPFNQTGVNMSLRSLAFTPVNHQREHLSNTRDTNTSLYNDEKSKQEMQPCETLGNGDFCDGKDPTLHATWALRAAGNEIGIQPNLNPEDLRI
ncbi:hypothetical protein B0J13DRAFT_633900 [Dactylonectria estremocensis]|uniref:Uncharacterized protein n=1 Tax=Dactylonectria estremocensis TaxID=1079267 RepID=A0A9P9JEN9_9HYPO|nr:hypothetical protein B0J13DRAFT_633900 [Dactylonectria estremocensis]